MSNDRRGELKAPTYEVFMLLISATSIVNSVLIIAGILTGPGRQVVELMEIGLVPILAFDFLYRLLTAASKREYFFRRWGWADMIAAVPLLGVFRVFRMVRVVRLLRQRGRERVAEQLFESRAMATFLLTIWLVFIVVEVTGATVLRAESADAAANITTAGDAIWWGLVTITTVGYGDQYPVTPEGRLIGMFLLVAGIALFSVLTGFIANAFLSPRKVRLAKITTPDARTAAIREVRRLLDEQEDRSAAIRARLDELERGLAASRADAGGPATQPAPPANPTSA